MQSAPKRLLVVDDEPDILEFLQVILQEEGYEVVTSEKGSLEQLHNGDLPDLILIDVLLSGKDGREVVKSLKSQQETKQIPIMMFSAHPSAQETAQQAGADDFLEKPFDIDVLLAKIAYHLE